MNLKTHFLANKARALLAVFFISSLFAPTELAAREIPVERLILGNQIHVARLEDQGDSLIPEFPHIFRHISVVDFRRYILGEHDIAKEMKEDELEKEDYPKTLQPFNDIKLDTIAEILAKYFGVSQYDPNITPLARLRLKTAIAQLNRIEAARKARYFEFMKLTPEQIYELQWAELVVDQFDARMFRRKELNIHGAYPEEYFKGEIAQFVKWNWTPEAHQEGSEMAAFLTRRFNPEVRYRPHRTHICAVKMARILH